MTADDVRALLGELGTFVRGQVLAGRGSAGDLAAVAGASAADTMYALDRLGDDGLLGWFRERWPGDEPARLVTEALDEPVVIGRGEPRWTVIVDPIDGTRGLMYDKRPAWVLAAAAPVGHGGARLSDVVAAAMTEIPTTKQALVDQLSATRGGGVTATRTDLRAGSTEPLVVQPSTATDLRHGWASFARFFPQGKILLARFEERLWVELYGSVPDDLAIFDDQYLATGGQFVELATGHDRLLGDLRPLAVAGPAMACHPYDCCTALVLEEAGCVLTDPWGGPLDVPLDTTTPVAWVGYANAALAELVGPAVTRAVRATFATA